MKFVNFSDEKLMKFFYRISILLDNMLTFSFLVSSVQTVEAHSIFSPIVPLLVIWFNNLLLNFIYVVTFIIYEFKHMNCPYVGNTL